MTQEQKTRLEDLRSCLYIKLNSISSDFVDDRALSDSAYISDSFTEYADSATSIYYSDQHNYYVEHSDECESALLEFYDPQSLADFVKDNGLYYLCCKAGAIGEYVKNESELYEDREEIIKCLIIDYLLNTDQYLDMSDIEEIAEEDLDRFSDYCDKISEKIQGE